MAGAVRRVCLLLIVNIVCNLELTVAANKAEAHPAPEFTKHALVKPRIYHGREKRQISSTKEEGGDHTHHITVDYDLDGENYILDLRLNRELIPKGFFTRYQQNGSHVVNRPTKEEVEICHYKGSVRGYENSWVAVSTCEGGLRGVVFDGSEMHYIETTDNGDTHYLYKHSDIKPNNKTCGYKGSADDHHHITENHEFNRILRYKRSTETLVRGPYNANKQSRYVELVLVVDNREYKELGESTKRVEQHCKNIANIINGLYSPLNIYIALVGVVVWSEFDDIVFSPNGDITLTNFLHFRRETLIKEHPNDNAQLLTKFTFENGVVGKALKGPICTFEYSGGVNTDHSPILGLVATTVAHEMGHNFGMEHDTNECTCPEERCIMAPSSSTVPPTHWSSCSLDYLALAFEHGMDYCLRNKPAALFDSPVCGNGFVEPGEQCDCGLPDHCDNTCCNATTCMLYRNASCATGECCDLNTCKPKNAGTLCRSADYECDLPEYCTGQSEYCPDDIYKMDTEMCDGGKAYCYHGFCRTRSDQCKLLWGNTGKSSDDQCYKMNTKGTRHGNCGYNKLNQSFFKCQDENVLCGMLHCRHLNERLEFGMESVAILSHSFINLKGLIIPCRTAIVDLGLNQIDPGLAPDGAKCGEGMMCVNQKCMAVDSLRKTVGGCPKDCNGNGVCNSLGHCHCKSGFAPPFCDYPGPGGSADSGPASDPNAHKSYVTAMFIIFLGIIPTFAILALITYYMKHNIKFTWKKSPSTTKSPQKTRSPPFSPESPKRTAEDNHSLLADPGPESPANPNEFFGQFKGFTLTPIKRNENNKENEPVRAAPTAPKNATAGIKNQNVGRSNTTATAVPNVVIKNASVARANSNVNKSKANAGKANLVSLNSAPGAPALPPLNPGSHPRPIISSPTLCNSTCTAKELISPLKNAPKLPIRQAPEAPVVEKNPAEEKPLTVTIEDPKKNKEKAINRIASFLKPSEKKPHVNTNSLPRKSKNKIDRDALRSIEISNPIPQSTIEIPIKTLPLEGEETKAVIMRAHSMRNNENKPKLQSFGSMRDPAGTKRPVSIVGGRPKSPPPPRPQELEKKEISPKKSQNQYDDCLNGTPFLHTIKDNSPSSDNIYAVIEETPTTSPVESKPTSSSTSNESFGLLGEIVSEIQNRNFDSIYSTSSIAKKEGEGEETDLYVNAPSYKSNDNESVYSNMNNVKSSASSTSSGYIHPSAVNLPVNRNKPEDDKTSKVEVNKLPNKIETDKVEVNKLPNKIGPKLGESKLPPNRVEAKTEPKTEKPEGVKISLTNKTEAPKPTPKPTLASFKTETKPEVSVKPAVKRADNKPFNRQITPPNLRTRKASPVRAAPKPAEQKQSSSAKTSTKSLSNSPDLVTSCSTPKTALVEAPDVLNNRVKKPVPVKPNLPKTVAKSKVNSAAKTVERKASSEAIKPPVAAKVKDAAVVSNGVKAASKQQSNVATLQQKFENKNVKSN